MKTWRFAVHFILLMVFVPVSVLAPSYRHCLGSNGHDAIELADGGHHVADRIALERIAAVSDKRPDRCSDRPLVASASDSPRAETIVGPAERDLPHYLARVLPNGCLIAGACNADGPCPRTERLATNVQLAMLTTIVLRI